MNKKKGFSLEFLTSWFLYILVCFTVSFIFYQVLSSYKNEVLIPEIIYKFPDKIKEDGKVYVKFNQPVKPALIEKSFKLSPAVQGNLLWEKDLSGFKFVPNQILKPNQLYTITFQGKTSLLIPFKGKKEFKTEAEPEIVKVAPYKDQGVKTNEKIFITFDKPAKDYELEFKLGVPIKTKEEKTTDEKIDDFIGEPSKFEEIESPNPEISEKNLNDYIKLLDFEVDYNEEKSEVIIMPKEELELNQKYKVETSIIFNTDKPGAIEKKINEFSFSTLEPLKFVESYPKGGVRDVSLDQKFTLTFNKAFDEESLRNSLKLIPPSPYKLEFSENNKTAALVPDNFQQDTKYKILIQKGLKAADSSYLKEDIGVEFLTGNLGGFVRDGRSSTADPFIKEGKYIDINLSTQLLSIFNDGVLLGTYKISSGRPGMRTPTGSFPVMRKENNHWSNTYDLWMPYSLQFTRAGHFIHELPEWPSGYKEGADHLGIPVSHGCVRLGVGPAEAVFNFVDVGSTIYIHY